VTQSEINYYLALLTSKRGQTGGVTSLPTEAQVSEFEIGQQTFGPDIQPIQQQTTQRRICGLRYHFASGPERHCPAGRSNYTIIAATATANATARVRAARTVRPTCPEDAT
jgi:hypothetical protein